MAVEFVLIAALVRFLEFLLSVMIVLSCEYFVIFVLVVVWLMLEEIVVK